MALLYTKEYDLFVGWVDLVPLAPLPEAIVPRPDAPGQVEEGMDTGSSAPPPLPFADPQLRGAPTADLHRGWRASHLKCGEAKKWCF